MLPSILPTSDIRSMFHFTRSGNVAALFFFDDSVLGRVRDAVLFNTASNDNSSQTGGGKNTATTTTKRSRSRIDTPEGLIAARHLWPILQQQQDHDENSDAARKNNNNSNPNKNPLAAPNALDDEEIELFLLVSDHIQISKVQARTRANSILTLRDRNRDSNAFSENYHTVSKVGGEEGMRLLLSTISPKNLHRFGIYGSLIESNQMISRFSDGRLAIGSSVVTSSSSNTANSQQQRKIGPSESDVSNSSFVSASGIDNSSFPSATSKTREGTEKQQQQQEQRSFFLGVYFEELRENAIEALGSDIFVHHVSAILRRVQHILSNSDTATKKSSSTTKTFTAAEQFDLPTGTLENAILNISNDQRFRAFSLFFECGFTFLLLGSSRLAVSYFTRSASIVSVLLRGAFPPSLLDRLRALLSLALAKFFAGFALQRCGYGPEAAQEFRRSRFALFDADAMCRAMMRSYTSTATTGTKGDDEDEEQDSHEKSSSMFRSNNVNGITLMKNKSRYLSNEINDLENDEEHQRHFQKKKTKTTSEERSDDSDDEDDEDDEESDTDEENNEDQERRGQSSKTAKVAQTLDDICGNEQGYNALMHVRHVIRSFIRHSMLHEGHAVSSTVISPLLFHVSSAVENAPVLGKPEDDQTNQNSFIERRKSLVEAAQSTTDRNQQQQQQQVLLDNTSWPAKQQLEICLKSLKVLDEVKNATFDIANNDMKNTHQNRATDADEEKHEKSGSGGRSASSFITMRKKSEKKVTNSSSSSTSSSPPRDIFLLTETAISLLLAVCFSPDISATKEHLRISSVSARAFLARGVEVSTSLITMCQEAINDMYPSSAKNELDVHSPWLAQRPMLRPGVLFASLLRHAYLLRAMFHSLRLLWAEAAADISVLVTQIEVAQEPVPNYIYGTLKLVNTALMQQRDSVHLVRTTKDVLPPVLPVENSRLSSENDVLLKLLPVIEVLRQTFLDASGARATVEVNFFSNGVVSERAAWKSFLESPQHPTGGGVILADGFRFDDYSASQSIRTSHSFDSVRVQDVIEARKTARLTTEHQKQTTSISTNNDNNNNTTVSSSSSDHKFLLPPFPFSTTLRCDVTGEVIPLQLDAPDTSTILFYQCKTCGLKVSPSAMNFSYSPEITNSIAHQLDLEQKKKLSLSSVLSKSTSNNNNVARKDTQNNAAPSSLTTTSLSDLESDARYQYYKSTTVMQKKRKEEEEQQKKLIGEKLMSSGSKNTDTSNNKNKNDGNPFLSPSGKGKTNQQLEKRVCVGKLTAAVLCHVGSIVRHCVSVAAASNTRFTLPDILDVKNDEDLERVIRKTKKSSSVLQNTTNSTNYSPSSNKSNQKFSQKWEADWKVGRMSAWDPVTFLNFDCASPQDSLIQKVLSETYALTANNSYEHLLWNPSSGNWPEAEPVVWVMPPDSFDLLDSINNDNSSLAGSVSNNNLVFSDIGLTLKKHMDKGRADCVLSGNAFEVIRDRVEDPSSDHTHRMVRARTTKSTASEAVKQSCCVVCGKSLLYSTSDILRQQEEEREREKMLVEEEEQRKKREEEDNEESRDDLHGMGRGVSGSGASAVLALANNNNQSETTPNSSKNNNTTDAVTPQRILSKDEYLRSSNKKLLQSKNVSSPSSDRQQQQQQRGDSFTNSTIKGLKTVGSSHSMLARGASMISTTSTKLGDDVSGSNSDNLAIFFFRCVICGAVVHKDCGFDHQEKCTSSIYNASSSSESSSLPSSPAPTTTKQRLSIHSSEEEAKRHHQKEENGGGVVENAKRTSSFLLNKYKINNSSFDVDSRQANQQPKKSDLSPASPIMDNDRNNNNTKNNNNNKKHPLRILNEYFDIDSLNSLKQDYDRMETAEAAAQKSGETLRKWVESDHRAGGGGAGSRNNNNETSYSTRNDSFLLRGSSQVRKARASIFSASMSNAAFFMNDNEDNENDGNDHDNNNSSQEPPHHYEGIGRCDSYPRLSPSPSSASGRGGSRSPPSRARSRSPHHNNTVNNNSMSMTGGSHSASRFSSALNQSRRKSSTVIFSPDMNKNINKSKNTTGLNGLKTTNIEDEILKSTSNYANSAAVTFVHSDQPLDEVGLRVVFNEYCDKKTQKISVAALDSICAHIGITGGHLIDQVARKTGGVVGKRISELQRRGLPVFSDAMRKKLVATASGTSFHSQLSSIPSDLGIPETTKMTFSPKRGMLQQAENNNINNNLDSTQLQRSQMEELQGLTLVRGSLNFEEFCLVMSLIPQG